MEFSINQKEIEFLREEVKIAKEKLVISEAKNVDIQDLKLKQVFCQIFHQF